MVGRAILCIFAVQIFHACCCFAQARPNPKLSPLVNKAAIEVVLRRELSLSVYGKSLCLEINGIDPTAELLHLLQSDGLRLRKASWCRRGPRGTVFSLTSTSAETDRPEITAEADDISLREVDFGVILHRYRYLLEFPPHGEPKILSKQKLCCDDSTAPPR